MADHTKFSKYLNKNVPVEVHPFAKYAADTMIKKMGGKPTVRTLDRGYPFITENGNLVLDCDFGTIKTPASLARKISTIAGVIEVGIFLRRPEHHLQARIFSRNRAPPPPLIRYPCESIWSAPSKTVSILPDATSGMLTDFAISAICIDVGTPYTVMLFFLQCLPKARTNAVAALPLPRPSI